MFRRLIGWLLFSLLSISIFNSTYCIVDDVHEEIHTTHTPFCSIPHVPMSIPHSEYETFYDFSNNVEKKKLVITDDDIPEFFIIEKPWRPPWIS